MAVCNVPKQGLRILPDQVVRDVQGTLRSNSSGYFARFFGGSLVGARARLVHSFESGKQGLVARVFSLKRCFSVEMCPEQVFAKSLMAFADFRQVHLEKPLWLQRPRRGSNLSLGSLSSNGFEHWSCETFLEGLFEFPMMAGGFAGGALYLLQSSK